jgi:hypothetical protein
MRMVSVGFRRRRAPLAVGAVLTLSPSVSGPASQAMTLQR